MHPYSQWQENPDNGRRTPSMLGALPSSHVSRADRVRYTFEQFKTTVLNSTIVGPEGRTAYRVNTEAKAPACTVLQHAVDCRTVAMVNWQPNAMLEIEGGLAPRQRVRDWLQLALDQSRRTMDVRGVLYAWLPIDQGICLHRVHTPAPRVLARVDRVPNALILELSQEAMELQLLEPALVAAVLLNCGHNID